VKDGITYAHAPTSALVKVVALRMHLDDSTAMNGPLRVLPGTHDSGVLSDDEVHDLSLRMQSVDCLVPRGGVLAMRPLVIHSSSKSRIEEARRVLHIEYAASLLVCPGVELAIA
jgi:ectoine hydroxylase-related dioxygenase (phytanoyl-CoA dioxygenase family)